MVLFPLNVAVVLGDILDRKERKKKTSLRDCEKERTRTRAPTGDISLDR